MPDSKFVMGSLLIATERVVMILIISTMYQADIRPKNQRNWKMLPKQLYYFIYL